MIRSTVSNLTPSLPSFLSRRFSMKPKNLSPNVESLVGEIGNEIHKPIKVPNIVTSKRSLQIYPGVFVVTHIIHSTGLFSGAQSPSPSHTYSVAHQGLVCCYVFHIPSLHSLPVPLSVGCGDRWVSHTTTPRYL